MALVYVAASTEEDREMARWFCMLLVFLVFALASARNVPKDAGLQGQKNFFAFGGVGGFAGVGSGIGGGGFPSLGGGDGGIGGLGGGSGLGGGGGLGGFPGSGGGLGGGIGGGIGGGKGDCGDGGSGLLHP
ncbi:hypothetical protein MANES_13G043400v8 [Manihot esculenta]|uniref:Uncharacterized protein n=2 Tax=Manihot esculenta TaxID=3983 RepID=A0ACB7GJ78_MANES|nr:hypothetical protein MANES_13G043400v8 [Manihot esculenta]